MAGLCKWKVQRSKLNSISGLPGFLKGVICLFLYCALFKPVLLYQPLAAGNVTKVSKRKLNAKSSFGQNLKNLQKEIVQLRTIADFTYDWEILEDPDGNILYVSPACKRITGYPPSSFKKNAELRKLIIVDDDIPAWESHQKEIRNKPGLHEIQFRIKTKDGKIKWIEHACQPVTGSDGKFKGYRSSNRDVTERKKTEDTLLEQVKIQQTFLDNFPPVSMLLRPKTREIVACNKAGKDVGASPGKICYETWGQSDKPCTWCQAGKLWQTGEAQHLVTEGLGIMWDAHWIPISDDLYLHYAYDITEKFRISEELAKRDKLETVGVLAGGIAHDFNNILGGVLGNISLAKMEISPESEAYEILNAAEKATIRAAALTKKLLTFSKGGLPVKEKTNMLDVIKESAEFILSGSNVLGQYQFSDDIETINVDKGQFSQAIQNLTINAVDAMPHGGILNFIAESSNLEQENQMNLPEGDYVKLICKDQGSGIPSDIIEKIFDPFFSTKPKGSGLGLSTTYSIIEQHGGHIGVESTVGQGTTFTIHLPLTANATSDEIKTISSYEKVTNLTDSSASGHILIMDDEEIMRDLPKRILSKAGYKVECTKNTPETILLYKDGIKKGEPFDLVILDLTIRGENGGKRTVKLLKKINENVKAIVCSGYTDDLVMSDSKDYGFCDSILKPYQPDELLHVISNCIDSEKCLP